MVGLFREIHNGHMNGMTPIFDSLAGMLPTYSEPPTPRFTMFGHKERKRLAGDTNRVLREAGFPVRRLDDQMRKDARIRKEVTQ